jgi:hypothetical protein
VRPLLVAISATAFLNLSCCALPQSGNSAVQTERSLTASCLAWEDRAKKAANPDATMIAEHDLLTAKAAKFYHEAQVQYKNEAIRHAAIENQVKAETDAAAIYDWRYNLKVATDCWNDLKIAEDIHREQRVRLEQLAIQLAAASEQQAAVAKHPRSTIHSQTMPATPTPLSSAPKRPSETTPVQTWNDTPYAPAVPPVMRDQPVTEVNPMIPPAAR